MSRRIHQTLHGYNGGHRLLSASCQLSPAEERHLLESTDLSGSRVEGFDEYLTGYRIPESKKYCFSKSWYAFEMERPGCVWTHSLLLEREDFSCVKNLRSLLNLFHRPVRGKYKSYETSIDLDSQILFPSNCRPGQASQVEDLKLYATVFHSLFERVHKLVIVADASAGHEDFVVGIWSQMWTDLRFRFSFCTGSFTNRVVKGQQLVLQIVPSRNVSSFRSDGGAFSSGKQSEKTVFIDSVFGRYPELPWDRYRQVFDSFRRGLFNHASWDDDNVQVFVWEFGAQMSPFRKNLGWLVRFYELLESSRGDFSQFEEISKALTGKYSGKEEQKELKRLVFGTQAQRERLVHLLTYHPEESDLIEYITLSTVSKSLDLIDLQLFDRVEMQWKTNPERAYEILIHLDSIDKWNPVQTDFLNRSAKFISQDRIGTLLDEHPAIADSILIKNPELSADKSIWQVGVDKQNQIFNSLTSKVKRGRPGVRTLKVWKKVVFAMLDARNDIFAQRIYDLFVDDVPKWILEWYSNDISAPPSGRWGELLWAQEEELVNWIAHADGSIGLKAQISHVLNPHSELVRRLGSKPWLELAEIGPDEFPVSERLEIFGFLLALGFGGADTSSFELVRKTFAEIYAAAEHAEISYGAWRHLEAIVPSGGIIFSWDKCRRLEEALIALVIERDWPVRLILESAGSSHVLKRLIKRADNYSYGRKALWKLKEEIDEGRTSPTSWQKKALDSYFR